jgi:hypothetical protein
MQKTKGDLLTPWRKDLTERITVVYLIENFFYPEDENSRFLKNADHLRNYTVITQI